jgi:hypothetical protein
MSLFEIETKSGVSRATSSHSGPFKKAKTCQGRRDHTKSNMSYVLDMRAVSSAVLTDWLNCSFYKRAYVVPRTTTSLQPRIETTVLLL